MVSVLKDAWRALFVSGLPRRAAMSRVKEEHGDVPEVEELLEFLANSQRGICRSGVG